MRPEHATGVNDTFLKANGHDGRYLWITEEALEEALTRFPDGQFAAVLDEDGQERVVGAAMMLRTSRPPTVRPLPWSEATGGYRLRRHEADGSWLYGVEIAVHPDFQRRGIASALYRERLGLVERLGLRGWYAGGMLMGYHRYRTRYRPREYAERVIRGELKDPTVSMQLNRGLTPWGIIEGYHPEPKAGDTAVLIGFEAGRRRARPQPTVPRTEARS